MQPIVTKEVSLMPIKFDIESDELYLEGIEKGVKKGVEKGIEQHQRETVIRGLQSGALSLDMIANLAGVSLEYVHKIRQELKAQP